MTRQEAEIILQRTFKLPKFYEEQWEAIDKILRGERVLLIEKTGFGKSLCFQFPATQFNGTTVIFSPLIALMRDQVKKLTALGISAKCINSEQTPEENTQIITLIIGNSSFCIQCFIFGCYCFEMFLIIILATAYSERSPPGS